MPPKVLLFNGPPGSGKDTCRKYLMQAHEDVFVSLRMAKALKDGVHTMLGLNVYEEEYADCKGEPHPDFFGRTPQEGYIEAAERFMKKLFGDEVFGHVWLRLLHQMEDPEQSDIWKNYIKFPIVIVADCGFGPEINPLISHFGADNIWLFRLFMQGCDYQSDSRGYVYNVLPFEREIVNIPGKPHLMLQQLDYILTVNKLYTEFYGTAE